METKNLKSIVETVAKDTKAVLTIKTAVKMNKKDVATKIIENPHGEIFKIAQLNVTLNPSYEQAVNEQLLSEGKESTFVAEAPTWGKSIGGALFEHNEMFYVAYIENEKITSKYVDANLETVEYDVFKDFMPVKKSSGAQGAEKVIQYRKVKLENILDVEIV